MSEYPWQPLTPGACAEIFAPLNGAWWIAGGVAIDLFIGRRTREHGDLDVALLRGFEPRLREVLPDWDVPIATSGAFIEWDGTAVGPDHHQFWARPSAEEPWALEVLLEDVHGATWSYRRDGRVQAPVRDIGAVTQDGIPYLQPHITLLYKAQPPGHESHRNAQDFNVALPAMSSTQRAWLRDALESISPGHSWIGRLRGQAHRL